MAKDFKSMPEDAVIAKVFNIYIMDRTDLQSTLDIFLLLGLTMLSSTLMTLGI